MRYRIELSKDSKKFLESIRDGKLARRFSTAIENLSDNPRPPGCLKMQANDGLYRIRVGDYRIIYQVRDAVLVVLVVDIGNRREVYR